MSKLTIYNTLSRSKELFVPLAAPFVGVYVCGPTVYGDPHLGHARPAITYDVLFRYLQDLGYKVRYVRNITDVGHLSDDADQGEDKIAKKAALEKLEPMEVAQYYTDRYHRAMEQLGVLPPSIEPRASGHIIEQIELVKELLDRGFAYQSNGSVYFDVDKYDARFGYGRLSGRNLDDIREGTRTLDGQDDKRHAYDFALWKRASPEHIMRWPSPWGEGFPGWHVECSAMSAKYLGDRFDIHGGGLDLMFPHHESEVAQGCAAGHEGAKYWMHNNMITIGGQKMGKSLGNFITLDEMFSGTHALLDQAYSPMTVRFFILQAHYRSTLDFGNEALQAAEKGLQRLLAGVAAIDRIMPGATSTVDISDLEVRFYGAMNDDLNTPIAISVLFDWVRTINQLAEGTGSISPDDLEQLRRLVHRLVFDILGLRDEAPAAQNDLVAPLVELLLAMRLAARERKDWAESDRIRDELARLGIDIKDRKDGTDWKVK